MEERIGQNRPKKDIDRTFYLKIWKRAIASGLFLFAGVMGNAHADISDLFGTFANELEERAARATLETYNRLIENEGCIDEGTIIEPPVAETDQNTTNAAVGAARLACTGQVLTLFNNIRAIIHTANQITEDNGPRSLSLLEQNREIPLPEDDTAFLGRVLRWTAAEEYAAQGTISGEFVNGQISGLSSRLNALRLGARGFNIAGLPNYGNGNASASRYGSRGGSAGADTSADTENYSPWGGFVNYAYGYGDKAPTGTEDAFDFDGSKINFGMDYIVNDRWIIGLVGGYADQEVDFDPSQSIVEGKITSSGFSLMPFFMYQVNNFFLSASAGIQNIDFDTNRTVRYQSFNPLVGDTDTQTVSNTEASMTSIFVEAGYSWQRNKWGLEPYVNVRSSDISVDGFIEDDVNDAAFDLVVRGQDISSVEYTLGLKTQYTFTPGSGVYVPYLSLEFVSQTEDAPRIIEAYYANDITALTSFNVPTSELDSSYSTVTVGVSSVLRGGRQREGDGAISGGVQGFANYKIISGLEGMSLSIFSIGLRYAF